MGFRMTVGRCVALLALSVPLAAQEGDPVAGEATFMTRCGDCHEVTAPGVAAASERPKQGPTLHGLFGRTAGTLPDFAYSDAMKASGLVWDEATLTAYMANPKQVVPKNRMPFNGLKRPGESEDIVAYLKASTQ